MATIREIADELEVSVSTVSAVVNNRGYVSPAMRERIEAALRRANYRPNEVARSLRLRATRTISLIVPDLTNSFYARLMRGVEDYLATQGYRLVVADSREDWSRQRDYLASFTSRMADGLMLVPCRSSEKELSTVHSLAEGRPLIFVDRAPASATVDSVLTDNIRAGYEATQHLLELGHKEIAIISEPLNLLNGAERLEGYRNALRSRGWRPDRTLIRVGDDTELSGYRCAIDLLGRRNRPTAIVACNNLMMLGLLRALRERRIACPRQISIIGFDDVEWWPYLATPLTSVNVPGAELGRAAAMLLLSRLQNIAPATPERVLLPANLVLRESTAAPAKGTRPRVRG
jgi:LacI family transcriptional regulator